MTIPTLGVMGVKVRLLEFALASAPGARAAGRYLSVEPIPPSSRYKAQKRRQPSTARMRQSFYHRITQRIDFALSYKKRRIHR